eukprot:tig00000158_g10132.t1
MFSPQSTPAPSGFAAYASTPGPSSLLGQSPAARIVSPPSTSIYAPNVLLPSFAQPGPSGSTYGSRTPSAGDGNREGITYGSSAYGSLARTPSSSRALHATTSFSPARESPAKDLKSSPLPPTDSLVDHAYTRMSLSGNEPSTPGPSSAATPGHGATSTPAATGAHDGTSMGRALADDPALFASAMDLSAKEREREGRKRWITVFGFDPRDASAVLQHFAKCGTIARHVGGPSPSCNWMHIKFESAVQAQSALSKEGEVLSGRTMLGVKPCKDEAVMKEDRVPLLLAGPEASSAAAAGGGGGGAEAPAASPFAAIPKASMFKPPVKEYEASLEGRSVLAAPKKGASIWTRVMEYTLGI